MATIVEIKQIQIESPKIECQICKEKIKLVAEDNIGGIHIIQNCQCKYFCAECLKSYVHNNVQNRLKDGLLKCPLTPKCNSYMDDDYVLKIADLKDREKYLKWKIEAVKLKTEPKKDTKKVLEKDEIDMLNKLGIKTKNCPKCCESIEKAEGCDHVRCPFCQTDFCWRCGESSFCLNLLLTT